LVVVEPTGDEEIQSSDPHGRGCRHMESFSVNDCRDVSFHDARFKQGDICKIVHGGDEICDVLPFMHKYELEIVNENYVV
jgi:hypothetical protein